jgi:hypothetical protein
MGPARGRPGADRAGLAGVAEGVGGHLAGAEHQLGGAFRIQAASTGLVGDILPYRPEIVTWELASAMFVSASFRVAWIAILP